MHIACRESKISSVPAVSITKLRYSHYKPTFVRIAGRNIFYFDNKSGATPNNYKTTRYAYLGLYLTNCTCQQYLIHLVTRSLSGREKNVIPKILFRNARPLMILKADYQPKNVEKGGKKTL
jgi:hypothetical protein